MTDSFHTSTSLIPGLTDLDLLSLNKPAQYLGGELNSIVKKQNSYSCRFALCFPDLYSLGMSNLGINLIYEIANDMPAVWCERVFMPEPDMISLLKSKNLSLCSLESKTPLNQFDLVGFSLQYELSITNVLAILELGKIQIFARDRSDDDPLVIAGGPACFNPAPFEAFFDVFFIGEAEFGITDILNSLIGRKQSRKEKLIALSKIPGVYVPGISTAVVLKRTETHFNDAAIVKSPLVPNIRTIHNRLSIEIMRGCARACRFCQAGYIYRPLRERSPQAILKNIDTALNSSGFEEISLLSLSSVDYCQIEPLLAEIMNSFAEENTTAISFPSTRVDGLTSGLLDQLKRVRQTAFTLAPEAGSERLRQVINKQISEEQILNCCSTVLGNGWKGIKLYFMIGLPTETDEDLEAIVNLALRIKRLPEAKGKAITVSVSTFVPKPHTPFQWCEQITPIEVKRRQELIYHQLTRYKIVLRYHQPFSSMLEGIFSRGDHQFAALAFKAYKYGAILDGWHEHLNQEAWEKAFAELNINPLDYLHQRNINDSLPWDNISIGAPKSFFLREYQRALNEDTTPNCFGPGCGGCNICKNDLQISRYTSGDSLLSTKVINKHRPPTPISRIRVRYQKRNELRFIGHLELVDVFLRAVKRTKLPICFSQGFHPLARIAFGPPLQLGLESVAEFLDLYLYEEMQAPNLISVLQSALPPSLLLISAEKMAMSEPSIQQAITSQKYELFSSKKLITPSSFLAMINSSANPLEFLHSNKILRSFNNPADKRTKTKEPSVFDLKEHLLHFACSQQGDSSCVVFELRYDHSKQNVRATDFAGYITELKLGEYTLRKLDSCFSS